MVDLSSGGCLKNPLLAPRSMARGHISGRRATRLPGPGHCPRSLLIIGFGELVVLGVVGLVGASVVGVWVGWWRWRGSLGAAGGFWGSRRGWWPSRWWCGRVRG